MGHTRENELFKKLNNGDASALDELIRLYYPEILRYCSWHTVNRQVAEDAAQETFLKAVAHLDSYIHQGKFRAFLYKIAVNICVDLRRQSKAWPPFEGEEYLEPGFAKAESDIDMKKLLDTLPDNQRQVVVLRYVHELKLREIAGILGEPLRTVQSRLRAALKSLKKILRKELRKMTKDLRERLKNVPLYGMEPSETHLLQTIQLARSAYAGRRRLRHISTFEIITSQFRFAVRPVWLLQGFALLSLCAFLCLTIESWRLGGKLPAFLSVSSVFVSMTFLPLYGRSRKHKMCELESTTRISYPRLIFAKLCAVTIGDIICLAAITLLALEKMTAPAQTVLAFILLPFLFCCTACLFILNRVKEEYGVGVSTGLCIAVGAFYWTMAGKLHPLPARLSVGLTSAVCAVLILALALECRRLMMRIPSPGLQEALIRRTIWNLK